MKRNCPNFNCSLPISIIRDGTFRRKDDSKVIQRFRCKNCGTRFSSATFLDTYRQKKRRVNAQLFNLLASGVSQRRAAFLLKINRTTIERKFVFLAERARKRNKKLLKPFHKRVHNLMIDDLITKENSKLKPLSVSIGVCAERRLILGAEVSQIPAFGHLATIAVKKYGKREDLLGTGLTKLFEKLKNFAVTEIEIKSDEHKRYPWFIQKYFPLGKHLTFPSERGCVAGQGELKKVKNDPLFIVNHTCAMLRANINRLFRRTWCSTKKPQRLQDHLDLFVYFYNVLLMKRLTPLKSGSLLEFVSHTSIEVSTKGPGNAICTNT
jgi:transposase-like protein